VDEGRFRWLALHLLSWEFPGTRLKFLKRLRSEEGGFGSLRAGADGIAPAGEWAGRAAWGRAFERAGRELEKIRRKAYTLLTLEDPGYPEALKEIYDPPFVLYCAGRTEALTNPAVAIVGSRKPTAYGRMMAERLGDDLGSRGCIVVSGLARGIDSCAHSGALRSGRTVAVLGSGLDVCYPRENRRLFERIVEGGAVLSEFPLETPPLGHHFPIRNRVISGLSLGLVVVEAAERSGSLISAKFALDQGREVLAVPGSAFSGQSRGANGLLKAGAGLVESWEDVAEALPSPWRENLLAENGKKKENRRDSLDREERRLVDELSPETPVHIDDLAERTGHSIARLLALLLGLELKGWVVQHPGKYFLRRT
jgi:DNA processing protein